MDPFEVLRTQVELASAETRVRLRDWLEATYDGSGFKRRNIIPLVPYERVDFASRLHTDLRAGCVVWKNLNSTADLERPAIYAIATAEDWLYVGFTRDIRLRRNNHTTTLRNRRHPNAALQRHWIEATGDLWFIVLELFANNSDLGRIRGKHEREIYWKRRLRPLCDYEPRRIDVSFLLNVETVAT